MDQTIFNWDVLRALNDCSYKAWQLQKDWERNIGLAQQEPEICQGELILKLSTTGKPVPADQVTLAAWSCQYVQATSISKGQIHFTKQQQNHVSSISLARYRQQGEKLLDKAREILSADEHPNFFRISHCAECKFWGACSAKLKQRDCISLLAGMTPKVLAKYHRKGILTTTQLSYLFKPRKRARKLHVTSQYLWPLKALAIREQRTFVLAPPEIEPTAEAIFIDFEGIPSEGWIYLICVLVHRADGSDESHSFWAGGLEGEKRIVLQLFDVLEQHPDCPVYHYGSYETKALKRIAKRYGSPIKNQTEVSLSRMRNLLAFLRTHVYPPTYSNGLKEVAHSLGFQWTEAGASGFACLQWRQEWERTGNEAIKDRLVNYNYEDCKALMVVEEWFRQLSSGNAISEVTEVASMKRHSPFKFQANPDYGEDFQCITQAAYFDYQRTKIYWRNEANPRVAKSTRQRPTKPKPGKGVAGWQPKKVHEVRIAPLLKKCPKCGSTKLYRLKSSNLPYKQTDLKFTSTGIRQWVIEHRVGRSKCAKCRAHLNDHTRRRFLYGDNLIAWAINLYVNYHVSHDMISRMLWEQFGIWMAREYLIMAKRRWWKQWCEDARYIFDMVRHSPVIHIDETTVKLSKERGYVWVFATTHSVYYHYTPTREPTFLKDWLAGYEGVIVTDFYPGYEALPFQHQKCLVHLIRDLNDDLFRNPFDQEYKQLVSAFSKLLRRIIETVDKYGLKKRHLKKHNLETEKFYKDCVEGKSTSELTRKYTKRLKKHWPQLWTFLHHDNVPWNNNNAEVAIKAFAQHRRGVKGQMSAQGLANYLEMLSMAQSCRYRDISFLDYLRFKVGVWENVPTKALPGFLPFKQAKLYAQRLGFQRKREWVAWKKAGNRPSFIPASPNKTYEKSGWVDWHDWLGFSFMPFSQARTYMRRLGLKNRDEYWDWRKSGRRPKTIPYSPEKVYKHTGWIDLGDWLGTGNKGQQRKPKVSYEVAKAFVQAIGIKSQQEFFEWRRSGDRPKNIPAAPESAYIEFEGWGEFLGTGRVANQNKKFWDYDRAKAFLKPLKIQSMNHYRQFHNLGILPPELPRSPIAYYKKRGSWVSNPDFFGKGAH